MILKVQSFIKQDEQCICVNSELLVFSSSSVVNFGKMIWVKLIYLIHYLQQSENLYVN